MTHVAQTTVQLSSMLRDYCGGASVLPVSAASVRAALAELERDHPNLYRSICDETGMVRRHINLFVNSNDVRDLDGLDSELAAGDVLIVLPSVSGG